MQQNYETMLEQLKKEFNEMERENIILKMFDEHNCELYSSLSNNTEYKNNSDEISRIHNEIEKNMKIQMK